MFNHNTKFEYKGIRTACVTDCTNQKPSKNFNVKKSKFLTSQKRKKYS